MQLYSFTSLLRSAPMEFHWRAFCLCGKHLKHLDTANTTHWSTLQSEPQCEHLKHCEWHSVTSSLSSAQILLRLFSLAGRGVKHLNERNTWRDKTLSIQCWRGGWRDGWHGVARRRSCQQTISTIERATMNMEHPPTNVKRLGLAQINGDSM